MKVLVGIVLLLLLCGCASMKNPYAYGSPQWFAWEQQRREAKEDMQRSIDQMDRAIDRSVQMNRTTYGPVYP